MTDKHTNTLFNRLPFLHLRANRIHGHVSSVRSMRPNVPPYARPFLYVCVCVRAGIRLNQTKGQKKKKSAFENFEKELRTYISGNKSFN